MSKIAYNEADVKHVFSINPTIDHVFVTADDHIFIPKSIGFCKSHCKLNNIESQKVYRYEVEEELEQEASKENTPATSTEEKPLEELSLAELKLIAQKFDPRFTTTKKVDAIAFINSAKGTVEPKKSEDLDQELDPVKTPVDSTENTEE